MQPEKAVLRFAYAVASKITLIIIRKRTLRAMQKEEFWSIRILEDLTTTCHFK